MDIRPAHPPDARVSARSGDAPSPPSRTPELSDAELLRWARRRGVVTFFIFFLIAVVIGLAWYLTR